ncbi:MAG: helix-turn-helix transcriptional regulator [Candidatus Anammoxibacter sp.]
MDEYDFTLKFYLPCNGIAPDTYIDKLMNEGCDDALIGVGNAGRIALNFTRTSDSARNAVFSAIRNVKSAIPGVRLIEATPDLVGLTDIANILGFSRQNMRKLMLKSGGLFPAPIHEGKSSFWHLANVLNWFLENEQYKVETSLVELAKMNMALNVCRERFDIEPEIERQAKALLA